MTEIGIFITAKLAEYLVDPIRRQARHLFCVSKVVKDLEAQKNELSTKQESVQKRVEEALSKTHEIEDSVKKWQDKVKDLITEVEKLQQELMENRGYFRGWCPTLKRYRLCKQLAKRTIAMKQLNKTSEFNTFSKPAPIPDIEYFSPGIFMCFESTKLALDEILEALRDDNCYMIGLYGMGGSGKTTLAKELGKKAKESNLFDRVAFTTVSRTLDVGNIQREIADLLGVKFEEESRAGKARRIALKLGSKERILVILDDVWSVLDLQDIGIPCNGKYNNCKVLLTTRDLQVCKLMDCQRNFPLGLLSEDEAWSLFQRHANMDDVSHVVAKEICKECKGLPIAVVAVGRSLKGKGIDEMNVALHRLRHSKPIDVKEGEEDAFTCLRFSYDYLRSENVKLLFLTCAMFPEDYNIPREDLFRYGKALGLCREVDSFETARNFVNSHINDLMDSCLLTHSDDNDDCFKMHDMVRDVALWIGSKQGHSVSVNPTKGLSALPEDVLEKDMLALCSWYGQIDHFSHQQDASKLEILVANLEDELNLSFALFEDIQAQKFVALKSRYLLQKLPMTESTQWLANLRTLRLVKLKLGDVSFVASLTRLEILDLHGSTFNELPEGIKELSKLKLLDLSDSDIKELCRGIEGCSQLQELYAFSRYFQVPWDFLDSATFPKLQRYQIYIGTCGLRSAWRCSSSKGLCLLNFNFSTSGAFLKDLLQRANEVCFEGLQGGCKNIFPEVDEAVGGMKACSNLKLAVCEEIECLSTDPSHSSSSGGHHTLIPACPKLCNLKRLEIDSCPKLMTLFPLSVAQTLVQLQELIISNCEELRHIIINEEEKLFQTDNSCLLFQQLKKLHVLGCDMLECIFPISYSHGFSQLQEVKIAHDSRLKSVIGMSNCAFSRGCNLSSLEELRIMGCPLFTSLFRTSVAQTLLRLEDANIEGCDELRHIIVNGGGDGLGFPRLKFLILEDCPKLQYVFPICSVQSLVELKIIIIDRVSELEYIFGPDDIKNCSTNENEIQIVFPLLQEFFVCDAPNILQILPENFCSRFPEVELSLTNCPKLTTSGFTTMAGSKKGPWHSSWRYSLEITNCGVENIFQVQRIGLDEDQQQLVALEFLRMYLGILPELRFIWTAPKQIFSLQFLETLQVNQCAKLKCIFNSAVHTSMPSLIYLGISECEELEEIFEGDGNFNNPPLGLPKLESLTVKRCNKLKNIFSTSIAMTLVQLESLHVSEAAQLEEVVRYEGEDITGNRRQIMLPKLKEIELKNLPSLIKVWHGLNVHEIKLEKIIINECPKFVPI